MTETIFSLLTRLSEAGDDAILPGGAARPHFGPAFDTLLNARVLEEQPPLIDWDVCEDCDCGLPVRPVRAEGDEFRADCPLDPREDVILGPDDLRTFRIDAPRLAATLARASGLAGADPLAPGVWHLGALSSGRLLFVSFTKATIDRTGLSLALKSAAKTSPATLLGPEPGPATRLRFEEAGIDTATLADVLSPGRAGLGVIDTSSLNVHAEARRLTIDKQARRGVFDGRALNLPTQMFALFELLADQALARDPVATNQRIAGTTGREPRDVIRELRQALVSQGLSNAEARSLVVSAHARGYRIDLPPEEISVVA